MFKTLEEKYLEHVIEIGIPKILNKKSSRTEIAEFLGYLLVLSSKNRINSLVTEISNLVTEKEHGKLKGYGKEQDEQSFVEVVYKIVHYPDEDKDGHTALYFVNKTNNLKNGIELLYNEKNAHNDRSEALKCIRSNAGTFRLDSWLLNTYMKQVHPKIGFGSNASAFIAVILQIFLSIIFFASDFFTDILLCKHYWTMAYDTSNAMNNSMCKIKNDYETCLLNQKWLNSSMIKTDDISLLVEIVENVNCTKSRTWISCIDIDIKKTQDQYKPAFCIMLLTIIISFSSYIWIAYKTKINVEGSCLKKVLLKPFWPLIYMKEEYVLRKNPEVELEDSLKGMESSWKLLKATENGIENYIQFFIQLFLLAPYISFLLTLPIKELFWMGVGNLIGIFSPPESLCGGNGGYTALGKLFLSIISLSYGTSSRQAARRGQTLGQTFKNLVLFLSYFFLCCARIISIFSILALDNPVLPALLFGSIHFALVLVTQVKTKQFTGEDVKELFPCLLTCIASHTVCINFHEKKTPTFNKQLLFHSVVMVENIILLMIPLLWPDIYPSADCFKITLSEIGIAGSLWITGIILLVSLS